MNAPVLTLSSKKMIFLKLRQNFRTTELQNYKILFCTAILYRFYDIFRRYFPITVHN